VGDLRADAHKLNLLLTLLGQQGVEGGSHVRCGIEQGAIQIKQGRTQRRRQFQRHQLFAAAINWAR
jgi:hypothetical protein